MRLLVILALTFIPFFTNAMSLGTNSPEVKTLQEALNTAGYTVTNYGEETTFFGPQTEAALTQFQIDNAQQILKGEGVLNNLGTLDPLTRAYLFNQGSVLGDTVTLFLVNLTPGMTHPDVQRLQQYLNQRGFTVAKSGAGSPGQETTYYGPGTKNAVIQYQEAYASAILTPNGLTNGTGLFLDATRNHVNAQLQGTQTTVTTTTTTDVTATAAPTGATRTLTVTLRGGGTVTTSSGQTCSLSPCVFTLPYKSRLTLTATPNTGASFTAWSGACSGTGTCTLTMSRNRSVTATFSAVSNPDSTPTTYNLTTAVSGSGSLTGTGISCPSDCAETYVSGTPVTILATPATGSSFAGWSGACTGTQTTCTVSMIQARTVSASFSQNLAASWVTVAEEDESFTLSAFTTVRYGANTTWTTLALSGTVSCSNSTFGDPLPGYTKYCQIPTGSGTTPTPTPVNGVCGSANGQSLTSAPTTNLCSTGSASSVTGSGPWYWSCGGTNGGTTAQCYAYLGNPNPTPTPTTYTLTVTRTGNGTISGTGVSCGSDCTETYVSGTSVSLTAAAASGYTFTSWGGACSGTGSCTVTMSQARSVSATFTQTTTTPPPMTSMPYINTSLIPAPAAGYSGIRLSNTGELGYRDPDGTGAFRSVCDYSHFNFDDAIVYPGQQGRAHLHVYFGNTQVNYLTTPTNLLTQGNSTCRGGTLNRSAYWIPAMIDTRNGAPMQPRMADVYYKSGYQGNTNESIQVPPQGLRMISGTASNTTVRPSWESHMMFNCESTVNGSYSESSTIPNCAEGDELWMHVGFPQCWDGVNLDSTDHKSHMTFGTWGVGCPSSHPVPIPEISIIARYPIVGGDTSTWRLSSDTNGAVAGTSAHGDWMNGWRGETTGEYIPDVWTQRLLNAGLSGGSHLIGDGRAMY